MVELGSSSMAQRDKDATKQCMDKSSGRHSKREGYIKGYQENIQNVKRSIVEYKSRENRYL